MNSAAKDKKFLSKIALILVISALTLPFFMPNENIAGAFIIICLAISLTLAILSRKEFSSKISLALTALCLIIGSVNLFLFNSAKDQAMDSSEKIDDFLELNREKLHLEGDSE